MKNSYESTSDALKVSHYSKSLLDNTEFESKSPEIDKKFEQYKTRAVSRQEKPFELSNTPQILRVVDVVPKPTFDHHVLDQTIGIPIRSCQDTVLNSDIYSNSYNYSKTLPNIQERLFISDKISNVTKNEPQIIHHPLISGNIPFNNVHETHKKILNQESKALLLPKSFSHENEKPVINRNISSRENGERNKVKFSNTVTVAVSSKHLTFSYFVHFADIASYCVFK